MFTAPGNPWRQFLALAACSLAACTSSPEVRQIALAGPLGELRTVAPSPSQAEERGMFAGLRKPGMLSQGYLGVSYQDTAERSGSGAQRVDGTSEELEWLPFGGGGFQARLPMDRVSLGYEVLLNATGGSARNITRSGGVGPPVDVDVDFFALDLHVGPLLNVPFGERWRAYGSLGPLIQFAQWDETEAGVERGGKGVGLGVYGRVGCEYATSPNQWIGLALRWSDSEVDLGSGLGDLELGGFQLVLSVSQVH